MEFEFVVRGLGDKPISVWEWKTIQELPKLDLENFRAVVDGFGKMSAEAQGLNAPVTFLSRLAATDQRLYLYCERVGGRTVVYGGLKSGKKKLFMRSESAAFKEITPVCCLDFCVCGKLRRQGYGKRLFDFFLQNEGLEASMVAYDAPSSKLLNFLTKHYGLRNYVPQSNNFVVFWQYFGDSGIGDWKSSGSLKDSRLRRGRQGSAPAGVPGAGGATVENGQFKGPCSSQDLLCAVDRVSQLQAASTSSPGAALVANRTFRHDEQKPHDSHESTSSSASPFPAVDLASPSLQQLRLDPFPSAPTSGRVVKFGRRSGQQSSWDGSVMNQVECGAPLQPPATPDPGSARVRGAAHRAGTGARDCLVW